MNVFSFRLRVGRGKLRQISWGHDQCHTFVDARDRAVGHQKIDDAHVGAFGKGHSFQEKCRSVGLNDEVGLGQIGADNDRTFKD